MDGASSSLRIHKKGFARKPDGEVAAGTLRNRRALDWKRRQKLVEDGIVPPPELPELPPRKRGRPPLTDAALELPEHFWARKQRAYRAAVADAKFQVELSTAAVALALIAAAPAAEAEAERRVANAQWKLRALERQLDASNASDGLVADGPRAIRLRAFARDGDATCECVVGALCDAMDMSGASDVRRMRCCGAGMCARDLNAWLRNHGKMDEKGYEDGVQGVEHVRRGRKIMYRMNTHRCPTCDRAVQSVRRALC